MPRYLSKSRFRLALECATKLYYTGKKEYANQNNTNEFLIELAKGGFQIGEYAKYFFTNDPQGITINTQAYEYEESTKQTKTWLNDKSKPVVAEGAFLYNNCYVRADILEKKNDGLYLYEVKAKGCDDSTAFFNKKEDIEPKWKSYLYDVAFQKWVIEKSTGKIVNAHLVLVNKDAASSVAGLAKHFKVMKGKNDQPYVALTPGITKNDFGNSLIKIINVDQECEWIYNNPVETDLNDTYSFEEFIDFAVAHYTQDRKILTPAGSKCRGCEFVASTTDESNGLRSGRKECWVKNGWVSEKDFETNLVLELWGGKAGGKSLIENLIHQNKTKRKLVTPMLKSKKNYALFYCVFSFNHSIDRH